MALEKANKTRSMKQVLERLDTLEKQSRENRAAAGITDTVVREAESEAAEISKEIKAEHTRDLTSPKGRGTSSARLIEKAQLQLFEGERRGDFTQFPISPSSEYPSLLTRLPLFVPAQRSTVTKRLDNDLSMPFETGWGKGRKFGPPLTIYDEDTLLALLALRQRQLVGAASKLPIKVTNPCGPNDETNVQVVYTTIGEIEEYLGAAKGGRGHKKRLASVKRLGGIVIEFTRISDPALYKLIKQQTFSTKLIDLVSQELDSDSVLYVQFPPVMVKWLAESYTYIEMDIRKQLTDNGKAIHKFLAGQRSFNIFVDKLITVTGTALTRKNFMRTLRQTMKKLETLGWCEYEIQGNGRRVPFKLTGRRKRRSK